MKKLTINAQGHENVLSSHEMTLEFTKETHLTPKGDCIVAVAADKGLVEFPQEFKDALKDEKAVLEIEIECGGITDKVTAYGHPGLILTHPTDCVIRKSGFICPRTLAIRAGKAASDLDRRLVEKLRTQGKVKITLTLK